MSKDVIISYLTRDTAIPCLLCKTFSLRHIGVDVEMLISQSNTVVLEFCNLIQTMLHLLPSCSNRFFSVAEYYVSTETTTWNNTSCTLATPELEFNAQVVKVKDDMDFQESNSEDPVWIGYYSAYQSFQYYGRLYILFIFRL